MIEQKNGFENFVELVQKVLNQEFKLGLIPNQYVNFGNSKYTYDLADLVKEHFVEIKKEYSSVLRGSYRDQINGRYRLLHQARSKKNPVLILVFSDSISDSDRDFFNNNLSEIDGSKPLLYDGNDIADLAGKYKIPFVRHANVNMSGNISTDSAIKGNLSSTKLDFEFKIQGLSNIYYGEELKDNIRDYNVFILPKSSQGGIGRNGISAKILEILSISRESFNFKDTLQKNRFTWITKKVNNKEYYFGFIVTRDKSKNLIDFSEQLEKAISLLKSGVLLKDKLGEQIKVFIPFLGAGQAGMKPMASLIEITKGVQLLRSLFPNIKIRINFPNSSTLDDQLAYKQFLETALSGPPPPSGLPNEEIENESQITNEGTDKIPFQLDLVEDIDRLNREPIAKSLTRLLNNQIFKTEESRGKKSSKKYAFMMHLQGAWGDGKSTFLNLIHQNLNTNTNKWIVINFNAWQHQHISPPWWPFLEQIYQQAICKIPLRINTHLWFREKWRRLIKYKGLSRLITLGLVLVFAFVLIKFYPTLFEFLNELNDSGTTTEPSQDKNIKFLLEVFITIGSLIGLFYTFANFVSKPFFITSPETAKTFLEHAADPMHKIKLHFESLIGDIKDSGFQTAIFIDDIDRCNSKFTVELLEGIQTLFKDSEVLYVVAGDKQWISTCFENHYKDYNNVIGESTQRLGYLFLEKAFQLSIRLPKVSGNVKQAYWDYILQLSEEQLPNKKELNQEERQIILEEIENEYSREDYSSPEILQEFKEKYDLNEDDATDIALEILDKDDEDVKHILRDHTDLLDANPRGIKRLANQYNMYRNTLIAEGRAFNRDKLFRWIILQNKYPVYTDWIEHNLATFQSDLISANQDWKDQIERDSFWKRLLLDSTEEKGGKLTITEIKVFIGATSVKDA